MQSNGVSMLMCAVVLTLCNASVQAPLSNLTSRFRELNFTWPVVRNFSDTDRIRLLSALRTAGIDAIVTVEKVPDDAIRPIKDEEMDSAVRRILTLAATASGSPLERHVAVKVVVLHEMLVQEKAMHKADDGLTFYTLHELHSVSPGLANEILAADKPLLVSDRRFAVTNLTFLIGAMRILTDEHPRTIANIIGWRLAQRWSIADDAAAKPSDDTWDRNTIVWLCILLGCAVILGVALLFGALYYACAPRGATSTQPQQHEMQQVSRPRRHPLSGRPLD